MFPGNGLTATTHQPQSPNHSLPAFPVVYWSLQGSLLRNMDSDGKAAISAALRFAAEAHDGQFRKGTRIPYLIHPLRVAKILIDYDCANELAIAGLLHDTVEDTDATIDEIRSIFGDNVARLVEFATEPAKLWSWEKRKQHTLRLLDAGDL